MSGFIIHETIRTENGVEVERSQRTTCSACGADLKSAEDWSRHRSMHTVITERDRANYCPKDCQK